MCWSELELRPNLTDIDSLVSQLTLTYYNGNPLLEISLTPSDDFEKKWNMLSPNNAVNQDVTSESIMVEMVDEYISSSNPLSPSLNNLHGSLDNLLEKPKIDFSLDKKLLTSNSDSDSLSDFESFGDEKILNKNYSQDYNFNSDSEDDDDNWRDKIERGTYTEKVRVKSKSITDLMVLTHLDYSESESETPFPSLTYHKMNNKSFKNLPSKPDLGYMSFGSEGNLLSLQDTVSDKTKVNDELKKFHEEYKFNQPECDNWGPKMDIFPEKSLNTESGFQERKTINGLSIQPQVFNLYNVAVNNFPYVNSKLNGYINLNGIYKNHDLVAKTDKCPERTYKQSQLSDSNNELCDSSLGTLMDNNAVAISKSDVDVVVNKGDKISEMILVHITETESNIEAQSFGTVFENANELSDHINMVVSNPNTEKECIVNNLTEEVYSENELIKYEGKQLDRSSCRLYKTIQLKIGLEKFSRIVLFSVAIEPYKNENGIWSLMSIENFVTIVKYNYNREIDIINDSGPESFIICSSTDKEFLMKQQFMDESSSCQALKNVWPRNDFNILDSAGNENLDYSLETWDNFLVKALDEQKDLHINMFDNFSTEPKSMLFINKIDLDDKDNKNLPCTCTSTPLKSGLGEECEKLDSLEGIDNSDMNDSNDLISTKEESNGLNPIYQGNNLDQVIFNKIISKY